MQEIKKEPVGELRFGNNKILADSTGKFTIQLVKGGAWDFDLGEINKLDSILADFEQIKTGMTERIFWRTNGSKFIQVNLYIDDVLPWLFGDNSYVGLIEGGTRNGSFSPKEISALRQNIKILTSHDSPIMREAMGEFADKKNTSNTPSFSYSIFGSPNKKYTYDLFVLMPFTLSLKPVYDDHIKKVGKILNLSIARADDFFSQNSIVYEVWSAITQASILIADCTGKNPNVFYEIGIAHTMGKPVILITQNQDDVPFDLRHIRYIQYEYTPSGMIKFENMLTTTIAEIMKDLSSGR